MSAIYTCLRATGHAINAAAGYLLVFVGYGAVWLIDRFYQLAGLLDREQNGRHWDREDEYRGD